MTPRSREERLALNEARVREVNQTIENASERLGPPPGADSADLRILCECGTRGCSRIVEITSAEYRDVRAQATRFVVVPGHEQGEIERVVLERNGFVIVEKVGAAASVAERTDPETPPAPSVL